MRDPHTNARRAWLREQHQSSFWTLAGWVAIAAWCVWLSDALLRSWTQGW